MGPETCGNSSSGEENTVTNLTLMSGVRVTMEAGYVCCGAMEIGGMTNMGSTSLHLLKFSILGGCQKQVSMTVTFSGSILSVE